MRLSLSHKYLLNASIVTDNVAILRRLWSMYYWYTRDPFTLLQNEITGSERGLIGISGLETSAWITYLLFDCHSQISFPHHYSSTPVHRLKVVDRNAKVLAPRGKDNLTCRNIIRLWWSGHIISVRNIFIRTSVLLARSFISEYCVSGVR